MCFKLFDLWSKGSAGVVVVVVVVVVAVVAIVAVVEGGCGIMLAESAADTEAFVDRTCEAEEEALSRLNGGWSDCCCGCCGCCWGSVRVLATWIIS